MHGWVGHVGLGGSCMGGVGHVGVGWGCLCRGGVCHSGVEWAVKNLLNNLICHKLGVLSFVLKNYCQLLSG